MHGACGVLPSSHDVPSLPLRPSVDSVRPGTVCRRFLGKEAKQRERPREEGGSKTLARIVGVVAVVRLPAAVVHGAGGRRPGGS